MSKFWSGNSKAARLTPAIVERIREEYKIPGVTQGDLARKYGVSVIQIGRIVRWESWANMPPPSDLSPEEKERVLAKTLISQKETEINGPVPLSSLQPEEKKPAFEYKRRSKEATDEELKRLLAEEAEREAKERGPSAVAKMMGGEANNLLDELTGGKDGTDTSSK